MGAKRARDEHEGFEEVTSVIYFSFWPPPQPHREGGLLDGTQRLCQVFKDLIISVSEFGWVRLLRRWQFVVILVKIPVIVVPEWGAPVGGHSPPRSPPEYVDVKCDLLVPTKHCLSYHLAP